MLAKQRIELLNEHEKMYKSETFNCDYRKITPQYPDKFYDWGIADIPLGIDVGNMSYIKNSSIKVKQSAGNVLKLKRREFETKDWDKEAPGQDYYDEFCRITKNQIIFGIDYVDWQNVGNGRIVWDKCVPEGMSFSRYETAYCSAIDYTHEIKLLWSGFMQAKSLSEPTTQQGNKKKNEKRIHITQKPVLLYKKLLLDFVKIGESVFDSHLGSGSIRIACDEYGVNFTGCEIDEQYFALEEQRFFEHKKQVKIFFN